MVVTMNFLYYNEFAIVTMHILQKQCIFYKNNAYSTVSSAVIMYILLKQCIFHSNKAFFIKTMHLLL